MPTLHIYWADKRPTENQPAVARVVSNAMASISETMITSPQDVTVWFHRVPVADIYVNGMSLASPDFDNDVQVGTDSED